MKSFRDFRRTSTRLYEELTIGKDLNLIELTSMAYEGETNTFPAERSMPDDLEDPTAVQMSEDDVSEDAPVNAVGGGAIAGLGVGPQGEPGVPVSHTRNKKKRAIIVGPPPVDPRMFQNKIFTHRPK